MWILGLKGLTAVRCKTIILSLAHEAKSRSWWWCADFFSKDTVRLSVNLTALIPAAPPELCWDEGGDCVDEPESERESWDNIGGVLSISSCDDKNNNNPFCQITLTYLNGTITWLEPADSHIHEASKSKRTGADLGGGFRGCAPPPPRMTCGFLIQLVLCKKKLCGLLVLK